MKGPQSAPLTHIEQLCIVWRIDKTIEQPQDRLGPAYRARSA